MGKRKKLENVCASKTLLTETVMNSPEKVEVMAIKMTLTMTIVQSIFEIWIKNRMTTWLMSVCFVRMPRPGTDFLLLITLHRK